MPVAQISRTSEASLFPPPIAVAKALQHVVTEKPVKAIGPGSSTSSADRPMMVRSPSPPASTRARPSLLDDPRFDPSKASPASLRDPSFALVWSYMTQDEKQDVLLREAGSSVQEERARARESKRLATTTDRDFFAGFDSIESFEAAREKVRDRERRLAASTELDSTLPFERNSSQARDGFISQSRSPRMEHPSTFARHRKPMFATPSPPPIVSPRMQLPAQQHVLFRAMEASRSTSRIDQRALGEMDAARQNLLARAEVALSRLNEGARQLESQQRREENMLLEQSSLGNSFSSYPSGSMTARTSTPSSIAMSIPHALPVPSFAPTMASSRVSALRLQSQAPEAWSRDPRPRLLPNGVPAAPKQGDAHVRMEGSHSPKSKVRTTRIPLYDDDASAQADEQYRSRLEMLLHDPHSEEKVSSEVGSFEKPTRNFPAQVSIPPLSALTSPDRNPSEYLRLLSHQNSEQLASLDHNYLRAIDAAHSQHMAERLQSAMQVKRLEEEEKQHAAQLKRKEKERLRLIAARRQQLLSS
jgi:hypothetical protein